MLAFLIVSLPGVTKGSVKPSHGGSMSYVVQILPKPGADGAYAIFSDVCQALRAADV
jgi:hypothetical protein